LKSAGAAFLFTGEGVDGGAEEGVVGTGGVEAVAEAGNPEEISLPVVVSAAEVADEVYRALMVLQESVKAQDDYLRRYTDSMHALNG
jgi:hypothetical protein